MNFTKFATDWDGVLADSRKTAFNITEEIADLFGLEAHITSMRDYRAVLAEVERAHTSDGHHDGLLRVLHRLIMRARAPDVPMFAEVVALVGRVRAPTAVISSSLRATIASQLDAHHLRVGRIFSHEDGLKETNLKAWAQDERCVYLTDNLKDIEHCREVGIAVIAVGWGFDSQADLTAAKPDWFVAAPNDLRDLLLNLKLITPQ
jgi:phosphoglycolate phosphatase-like HAD superfamily hydrolase